MILYNLKQSGANLYTITKFDDDLNKESSYDVSEIGCTCPQAHKPTCRHRKMLGAMLKIVDTEFFYCFDDSTYRTANGQLAPKASQEPTLPKLTGLQDELILAGFHQPEVVERLNRPADALITPTLRRRI